MRPRSIRAVVAGYGLAVSLALPACSGRAPRPETGTPVPPDGILATWVELVPEQAGSNQQARAIVTGSKCPGLELVDSSGDSVRTSLQTRASSDGNGFPVTSCEALLPPGTRQARVLSHSLPLLPREPRRILVIGDTGCRLKGKAIQACNDPEKWPFASATKAGADWKPDVVIHVGDYYYRESPCPARNTGCEGSQWGDQWESWREDFFAPAQPLLEAAPWLLARGNHEDCSRGGEGWDRFLEARPYGPCTDEQPPLVIPLGDHRIELVDSAVESNIPVSLRALRSQKGKAEPAWLVTHRPILSKRLGGKTKSDEVPAGVQVILVGHRHLFGLIRSSDRSPPELITGNGGTELEQPPKEYPAEAGNGEPAELHDPGSEGMLWWKFGFLTLERESERHWKVTERGRDGHEIATCELVESGDLSGPGQLVCAKLRRSGF